MIDGALQDSKKWIHYVYAKDYLYNDNMWLTSVQQQINEIIPDNCKDVVLFGHKKDRTTFYLNLFPQWEFVEVGDLDPNINATRVRDMYFKCDLIDLKRVVPENVFSMLKSNMMSTSVDPSPSYLRLSEEYRHINEYKDLWKDSPFPPTFVTVDAVLIKSGHVLVVRRRGAPGRGLIALPGGFIKQDEFIFDACLRELKEETAIKLTKDELRSTLRDQRVFDHPDRDLRGRTITHAYCFDLGNGTLPKVKGEDDADKAWWMSLRDLFSKEEMFYGDHFHIVNYFVNRF
jgi:bifunctional NMN adenylyltransferase/nudix hydrolase